MHDAGSVAEQLLALHAEPIRYRPRLTHGREPFAGGIHVFRFAQGKFPQGLARRLSATQREGVQAAAQFFVRQICFWDGATHYQVLCVAPDSRLPNIREHYKGLIALIHPDRKADGEESWPNEFAQRANKAWAVLSHDASRHEYDAGLRKAGYASRPFDGFEPVPAGLAPEDMAGVRKGRASRPRLRTSVGVASVALASLFFAYTWWASHIPSEYATLQRAAPFEFSLRWMRDAGSRVKLPGFLGVTEARPTGEPASADDDPEVTRASLPERKPRAALAPELVESAPVPPPARSESALRQPPAMPAPVTAPKPAQPARAQPDIPRAVVAKQVQTAQATQAASAAPDFASRLPDLEVLVTRIVAYYEAGDLDRFLGLYDADSMGVLESYRVRRDFDDFFQATSTRRLRIDRVSWSPAEGTIRAKGQATVVADYRDPQNRLERRVDIAIDVVMIGGRPRIARMSLFPHE